MTPKISIQPIENLISCVFPAGKYMVIDLCYIYPNEHWSKYVELNFDGTEKGKDWNGSVLEYNGRKIFNCATAYGDGSYPLYSKGRHIASLPVDAGGLSIVPMELVNEWTKEPRGGAIIDCESDFRIEVFGREKGRKGNFKFAGYTVITDDFEEEI